MKTADLINDLSTGVKAIKPMPRTFIRTLWIMGAMLAGISLSLALIPFRPDIHQALGQKQFLFGAGILILGWIVEAYSLALLQLPTTDSRKYLAAGLGVIAVLALGYIFQQSQSTVAGSFHDGISLAGAKCGLYASVTSFLPGLLLFFVLRNGAPTHNIWFGINLGICAVIPAVFVGQFFCDINLPMHLLVWHVIVPFVFVSGVGILAGRSILKW